MKKIDFSKQFLKQLKKSPLEIKIAFRNRFDLFSKDSFHSQLDNHLLSGKFAGYRSINITGDWRAIYLERKENDERIIIFILLGTHSQLYKR